MKINKITAALRGAKNGLDTGKLHDCEFGTPFFGCALGELFHAAGLNRRTIDKALSTDDADYHEISDGLLARVYGIEEDEVPCFHGTNDMFNGNPIERRDYMVRWARHFHKFRKEGLDPCNASARARSGARAS